MVLAGEQLAERLERLGFGTLRQLVRPPGLARPARGAVTVALGEKGSRQRETALGLVGLSPVKPANRGCVEALLPQPCLRPRRRISAMPANPGLFGNERRKAGLNFASAVRGRKDVPFDELCARRGSPNFLGRRSPRVVLARRAKANGFVDRCKVAGESGRCRCALG